MVVYISLFHPEQVVQLFRWIERVTYPGDIAQVVFITFIYLDVNVYCFVIKWGNTVFDDHCVTVSQFVILVDDKLFVFFIFFVDELLGSEQVFQLTFFVGLLHHTFQFRSLDGFVSNDGNLVYFNFFLLVDIYINNHLVIVCYIVFLRNDDFCILKTFIIEVTFNQSFGTIHEVRGDLAAFDKAESCFKVLSFRLFHTVITNLRDTWPLRKIDFQPYFIAFYFLGRNLHV